jgi:hypothetical protein
MVQAAFTFQAADHYYCRLHYQLQLLHRHDEGSADVEILINIIAINALK